MLQAQRVPQTGSRGCRASPLSSSSLLQRTPSASCYSSSSTTSSSISFLRTNSIQPSLSSSCRKHVVPSALANLLWPLSSRAADGVSSSDLQALERSLNPIPPPPIFVSDAATCLLIQAEIQGKLKSAEEDDGSWDIFSSFGSQRDAKSPVFIEMHDGHHVSLAPSLFKTSPATFALSRLSYSKLISCSSSNVKTALKVAA